MKNLHIVELVEEKGVAHLSSAELAAVDDHISECLECRNAFLVLNASATLIKARLAEVVDPPQFFATRVMALIREKQSDSEGVTLSGLWRTARGLITAMAATVMILGGLTIFEGFGQTDLPNASLASTSPYSDERVLFQDAYQNVNYDPTNGQVYQTVLGPEDPDAEY